MAECTRQPSSRRRWLAGVWGDVGCIPRSPLSFGFQLQGFYYVLCDTCVLLVAYLPFALIVKWTPPLPFSLTHTRTLPPLSQLLLELQSCSNRLLFGYWARARRKTLFSDQSLFTVFLWLTYIHGQGGNRRTQTYVHTDKEAILSWLLILPFVKEITYNQSFFSPNLTR